MIAVTNRHYFDGHPDPEQAFLEQISRIAALKDPPRAIVLREKDLEEGAYRRLAERVQETLCTSCAVDAQIADRSTRQRAPVLILHGHVKICRDMGIANIHLPLQRLSEIYENDPQSLKGFYHIGTSVHSVEDAVRAVQCGATDCFAGNVFETTCKPGLEGRGLKFLRSVVRAVPIPVYAIGGISPERMPQVLETGAAGGCMMSGFMEFSDPTP